MPVNLVWLTGLKRAFNLPGHLHSELTRYVSQIVPAICTCFALGMCVRFTYHGGWRMQCTAVARLRRSGQGRYPGPPQSRPSGDEQRHKNDVALDL